ncbi:MAG: hypothetical protein IPL97_09545 [Niastella sp.]|nr:hypothetical protein [Niastella sp.]
MKLKQLLPLLLLLILSSVAFAQSENPFASIGKKGKILTLTKGQYNETFDTDTIQQIGSSLINVHTMKVVKLLTDDESKKRLEGETHSRFLSVDPLTSSFPFYSPYQYAGNTPIQAIDLDGLEEYVVVTELYKNGKPKSITIQYTKDKANNNVNVHFREALGKNTDGSTKLGEYLTGNKVLRIVRDANGNEKLGKMNDELSKEELAVIKKHVTNETPTNPQNDAWDITIGKTPYLSETERNTSIMKDKVAVQNFPLIKDLNQTFGTSGIYIGGTANLPGFDRSGKGNIKNGQMDWLDPDNRNLKSLISDIKEDGGIKSISISVSLNISNCTDAEYQTFKSGVESVGAQMRAAFSKAGVNASNINVTTQALRDNQGAAQGTQVTLTR